MGIFYRISWVFLFTFLLSCGHSTKNEGSGVLWHIVSQQCLEQGKYKNQKINPCIHVDTENGVKQGHVVYKNRVGILQYLLMPTEPISGIESSKLLSDKYPNYIYLAWEAKSYMDRKMRSKIEPENIALAINSKLGRTQNHFHIHISCIKPEVKKTIEDEQSKIGDKWEKLSEQINGHTYFARMMTIEDLKNENILKSIEIEIPGASPSLAEFGMGLTAIKDSAQPEGYKFVALATKADKATKHKAVVEEIQDHDCRLLFPL